MRRGEVETIARGIVAPASPEGPKMIASAPRWPFSDERRRAGDGVWPAARDLARELWRATESAEEGVEMEGVPRPQRHVGCRPRS